MKKFTADGLKDALFQKKLIFKNEQLRRQFFEDDPNLPPNLEVIPHRDRQIDELQHTFASIAKGRKAYAKVYGPNGTGKTLTVNWLSQIVQKGLISQGKSDSLHISYINCAIERGSYREIFRKIINTFPAHIQQKVISKKRGVRLPLSESGLPPETYFNIFRECYRLYNRQLLIILDEFDKISKKSEISQDATDIIYNLVEVAKPTINDPEIHRAVDVIVIVNSMQRFQTMIAAHAVTRFQGPEVHFGTYSLEELIEILETRRPAFQLNVLNEEVIPEIAEYVALGEGNARVAIELLGLSGDIAETTKSPVITIENVREAIKIQENKLLAKPILELNFDHTLTYITVFVMYFINQESNRKLIVRPILYNAYKYIYSQLIESDPRSVEYIRKKTPRQFKRYLDGQLENEHLIISTGGRPIYYGIPPEYTPDTIKRILLENPIVKEYPVLKNFIQYQTPELRDILLDSQKNLVNYLDT